MTKALHPIAGLAAFLMILTFWVATIVTEAFGSAAQITAVKTSILWGFLVLVPALAMAGGTGFARGRGMTGGMAARKRRRMPVIALNGVLLLMPSAFFLASKAAAGEFDTAFVAIQSLELAAGLVNISLLGLNIRDGLRMTGRLRPARRAGKPGPAVGTR